MINNVTLTGRLIKDLELRYTPTGVAILKFTLAVNRRFKKEGQPEADFISCTAFQKTAETMANFLSKGALIGIEGSIQTGSYEGQDGKRVYTTDVIVEKFTFLESKQQNQQNQATQQQNLQQHVAAAGGYQQPEYQQQAPQQQYQKKPQYQQQNVYQQPPQQQQYGQGNPFGNNGPVEVKQEDLPF